MNSLLGSTAELAILLKLKNEVTGPLNNIERQLSGLDTKTATVSGGLTKIGGGLALGAVRVAAGLVAVGGSVAAVAVSATQAAAGYQSAMELVHTQAGATQAEVDSMSASLLDLAPKVGTSATDLAAGLYHIESAGVRGAQALQELTIAAEGAKVGEASLEDVSNALVGAVNTGISGTQNMSEAMGTLNAIVGSGNMRMADLTGAIATGILPTAKSMGLTLTDVGAALADMTDQGVPAVDAATRLRMTFSLMAAPTSKATSALKEIGMSSTAMANDMRQPNGLLVALTDLETHLKGSGKSAVEQTQIISAAFGGGRTSSTILTLINSLDRLQTKYTDITAGANSFASAWNDTSLTITQRQAALGAGIDALKIQLGDELLPVEGKVLDALTKLASDPAVTQGITDFGTALAGMFTDQNIANAESFVSGVIPGIKDFATSVLPPLEEGLKITGAAAKQAFDMFMALPEPVKAAVIAALAANKLTGGLVASGIGDLAKVVMGGGAGGIAGALGVQNVYVTNWAMMGGGGNTLVQTAETAAPALLAWLAPLAVTAVAAGYGFSKILDALNQNNQLSAQGLDSTQIQAVKYAMMSEQDRQQAGRHGYGQLADYMPELESALAKLYPDYPSLQEALTEAQKAGNTDLVAALKVDIGALIPIDTAKTVAPVSHDTSGVDYSKQAAALQAVAAAMAHDTSGSDMHAASRTLDSAVSTWRNTTLPKLDQDIRMGFQGIPAPIVNVNLNSNTVVSIRDVNNANVHTTSYRTVVPI